MHHYVHLMVCLAMLVPLINMRCSSLPSDYPLMPVMLNAAGAKHKGECLHMSKAHRREVGQHATAL